MVDVAAKPDLLLVLEDAGYRLTGPRRQVVGHLSQRGAPFSMEDVCSELPWVGRATVYRTIKLLLEVGALCKATMPNGAPRYSLDHAHHHHHVVCVRCGRVEEFRHASVERMLRAMVGAISGQVVGHRIELYITCSECLNESQPG